MKKNLSNIDMLVLEIVTRLRGVRAETLVHLAKFADITVEALRKRMERLCETGYLAASALPVGQKIFRLTAKGTKLLGAPACFANSPSTNIAVEILSVSFLACQSGEFVFPKRLEFDALLSELSKVADVEPPAAKALPTTGRFCIRQASRKDEQGQTISESQLLFLISELRPADQLVKRAEVVLQNLSRTHVFSSLISVGLLGVAIVVPTEGVKATLEKMHLPSGTAIQVVPAIQDVVK